MITTDKVPVTTGFRVWKLNGTSIVSGMIIQTNDEWTVKWPDSMEYFWEMPNGEVNAELFGREDNAINVLIYRATKQMERLSELVESLEDRLKDRLKELK